MRGKGSIPAVSRASGVSGHDADMICGASNQARDVRKDVLVIVPSLSQVGRPGSIVRCSPVLKVHSGAQSVGINCSVESG